ncbi:hypothetical protein TSUD_31350 [Trifolium subterraneum]|uniref:Aluminum-activated malate transporter n=1 Tax=Trifolium subterraneum TaxID=3900 RepID=A0A2Z6MLP3_TRISU|nr:hypothetical protein TSUD_31350 [Trifolium subterraneum]
MAQDDKGVVKEVEWIIKVEDGPWKRNEISCGLWTFIVSLYLKLCKFMKKAWDIGVNDPKKFIHCLKVGIALTVVSLFYYLNPLYDGVGKNAMWAVMTVVVVFEYTAVSAATFSRFIPTIKARFDYGVLIFILTFCLVSISVSTFIYPVWAGLELYVLVTKNLDKLANSLEGCVAQYFEARTASVESNKKLMDYKCVLNSKATEDSMV